MKPIFLILLSSITFSISAQSELLCQGGYWTEAEAVEVMKDFKSQWTSQKDWEERADIIRQGIVNGLQWDRMPKVDAVPNVISSLPQKKEGYSVQNIALESFPGFYVTGNLYTPSNLKPPFAGILSTHGHFADARFTEEEQMRNASLAQMGAVVFAYDMVGYGESTTVDHKMPIALLLQTWNSKRVLDYLLSREDIDPERIAITGASGGGTQSFILGAIDSRLKVSVPVVQVSAHFFGGCVCESGMPIHKSQSHQTNNVEIAALFAPKPQLLVSDGADWTKNTPKVEFPYLQEVYQVYDATAKIENAHFEKEKHNYGPSKRNAAYRFLSTYLELPGGVGPNKNVFDESSVSLLSPEELKLFSTRSRPQNELIGNEAVLTYLKIKLQE